MNLTKQISLFNSFNWNNAVNKNIFQNNISNRATALHPKKLGFGKNYI